MFFFDQEFVTFGHPFDTIENLYTGTNSDAAAPLTITVSTVAPGVFPEPATWALMLTGFGLAGTAMRRRPVALVSHA